MENVINGPQGGLTVAAVYATRALARERGLAILAMGLNYWITEHEGGYGLLVREGQEAEVRRQLALYDEEVKEDRALPPAPAVQDYGRGMPGLVLYVVVLLAVFYLQKSTDLGLEGAWIRDGVKIFSEGEWWRIFTAVLMHGDAAHLAGNVIFGLIFAPWVSRGYGAWVGWGLVLVSAALGNLGTAGIFWPEASRSLGASSAVFAMPGLLLAHALWHAPRRRGLDRYRPLFAPILGAVSLLGLFGITDDLRTDVLAHVLSFAAALPLGLAYWWGRRKVTGAGAPSLAV